jgi:uncharacterized protein (DUF697 family)/uncharacterized tellurite resistance protein B-like protein
MNEEILASIRVLVAIARADGTIHPNERAAVENAIGDAVLPGNVKLQTLLDENVDVAAQLARITTPEVRARTYEAACAMVYVDGDADTAEKRILEQIRSAFGLAEERGFVETLKKELRQDWSPSTIEKIDDAAKRDDEVQRAIGRFARRSAVLGAFPLPLVGEFLISFLEFRMLSVLAALYGHRWDAAYWKAAVPSIAGVGLSRFAVQSLVKLVPGWGSAVGLTASYATTYALGKAAVVYYEKGEAVDPADLKAVFATARKEGVLLAENMRSEIDAEKASFEKAKASLDADLAAGKLTETEYAARIVSLE